MAIYIVTSFCFVYNKAERRTAMIDEPETLPTLSDKAWLRRTYEVEKKTVGEIAKLTCRSPASVVGAMRRHGIDSRPRAKPRTERACANCGKVFLVGGGGKAKNAKRCCGYRCAKLLKYKDTLHCKEWLISKYVVDRLSAYEVAKLAGSSDYPVYLALERFGIQIRTQSETKKHVFDRRGRKFVSKQEMIDAYGGRCACCGEAEPEFLTLDHVGGGGGEHRKKFRDNGRNHVVGIRYELKKAGWPKDKYRLLCMSCNWATSRNKTCPHALLHAQGLTRLVLTLTADEVSALRSLTGTLGEKVAAALNHTHKEP
jgi:hypothetical protein